jgi:serpin B
MRRLRTHSVVPIFAAALLATACSSATVNAPGGSQPPARTSLPRELSAAESATRSAANQFSFALWQRLNAAGRDSNIFVSPLSASYALAMAMNGAAGQTLDEMRATLGFESMSLGDIDKSYASLTKLLTTLDPKVTMEIANSIWYRQSFPFNQSFLDTGAQYFDAAIRPLDFSQPDAAKATINGWVKQATHDKIPSIIDEIHDDDVMFLINAIYFKGSWRSRFDPAQTESAPFHAVGGDQPAKLMHREGKISYTATPTYDAVDLAYGDSAFTMTVILPKPGTDVESVAASLTNDEWSALAGRFHPTQVELWLPKLTLEWKRKLIPDLQALGMRAPFVPNGADFSAMSPAGKQLYISSVDQKTFVAIDEEGTEAAAVTSTGVSVTSMPVTIPVRVDRPFIFAIRERLTGTVLFMGKIVRITES